MERDSDTMNSHGHDEHKREVPDPTTVAGVLLVLTALLPYDVVYIPGSPAGVEAQFWYYAYGQFAVILGSWIVTPLVFLILRYVFALQMMRYYRGSTSRRRTLAVALVAEVPLLIYSIGSLIAWLASHLHLIVIIPLPIPLFLALLIIRWFPPRRLDDGWLEDK